MKTTEYCTKIWILLDPKSTSSTTESGCATSLRGGKILTLGRGARSGTYGCIIQPHGRAPCLRAEKKSTASKKKDHHFMNTENRIGEDNTQQFKIVTRCILHQATFNSTTIAASDRKKSRNINLPARRRHPGSFERIGTGDENKKK